MSNSRRPILTVLLIIVVAAIVLGSALSVAIHIFSPSADLLFSEKIGVIPVEGAITSSQNVTSQLVKFRKDKSIRAIILKINSPGGAIAPSQEIYREVQKTIPVKKVVAAMGTVAASGGYYIAAAASRIVANPGTITGSIGVIVEFVNMEDLLNKIGVDLEIVKSGEFKDMGSPDRKLTDKEREILQALVMDMQNQFMEAIARGRRLPLEKVRAMADGRVFSGAQARELGLVDFLGNFQDAVETTKELAGIKGEVTLIYPEKSGLELLDLLLDTGVRFAARLIRDLRCRVEYRWNGLSGLQIRESY
ncbi:MAG: signal peptide peptidase SppA [Deltaproteobacteria bacterium]|nr:signal peptide peptidase SppA [Deltaproteobacteria bacterium]MBW2048607.1 signal peptide peptidase SppA [Deltaproteobacteria bacterium]MBW2110546.1 signal peptide peptidase SppA [Deltaproteobacteria bacterium]MBW2353682.1 signal peptide peptidase SppA [Deltaproteobacteria bacterium]